MNTRTDLRKLKREERKRARADERRLRQHRRIERWGRWVLLSGSDEAWICRRFAIRGLVKHMEQVATIPHLVRAVGVKDVKVAQRAGNALRSLKSLDAVNALIDLAVNEQWAGSVMPLIDQQGYRHSENGRWFLYLILAGRFDEYLDGGDAFKRLRAEFSAAPEPLKTRIRETVLNSGDPRMSPLFMAEKREAPLIDISDSDAELLVAVYSRNEKWLDLFRFLWFLPARCILKAIQAMVAARWSPEDPNWADLFARLSDLSRDMQQSPEETIRAATVIGPVIEQWMRPDENVSACATEKQLSTDIECYASPREQVAALASLRRKGGLTQALLRRAAESPHWPVRLASASMTGEWKPLDEGAILWMERLSPVLSGETLWGERPCEVSRDGLEALRQGLSAMSFSRKAGGLLLVEALASHYASHQIEVHADARMIVAGDTLEIVG